MEYPPQVVPAGSLIVFPAPVKANFTSAEAVVWVGVLIVGLVVDLVDLVVGVVVLLVAAVSVVPEGVVEGVSEEMSVDSSTYSSEMSSPSSRSKLVSSELGVMVSGVVEEVEVVVSVVTGTLRLIPMPHPVVVINKTMTMNKTRTFEKKRVLIGFLPFLFFLPRFLRFWGWVCF